MKYLYKIALLAIACGSLGWLAAPVRADVLVTIFNGNPIGAGNGTPNLNFSMLPQVATYPYYGVAFGVDNQNNWRPLYRDNNYSARIIGQFNVAQTGTYTFSTTSDDGSVLRIDNMPVVNNNFYQGPTTRTGAVTLAAGIHNFEVQFFQGGGGKSLDLGSGAGALINRLPAGVSIVAHSNVPQLQTNVYADTPGARRFDTTTGAVINPGNPLIGSLLTPAVNFDYGSGSQWTPFGRGDDYSVDVIGFLLVDALANYTFGLNSDDGSWLFIDGSPVVNNGGFHGSNQTPNFGNPQAQGSVTLTAGFHFFEVRMFEAGGGAGVNLYLPAAGVRYATPQDIVAGGLPEPSSFALAGLGLAALAAFGWRRWKRGC